VDTRGVNRGLRHENGILSCYDTVWQRAGCGDAFGGVERRPREKEALPLELPPPKNLLRESCSVRGVVCGPGKSEGQTGGIRARVWLVEFWDSEKRKEEISGMYVSEHMLDAKSMGLWTRTANKGSLQEHGPHFRISPRCPLGVLVVCFRGR